MVDKGLKVVFIVKICVTLLVWCAPLIVFPSEWLGELGFPWMGSVIFLKLLGAAYAALVVAYFAGRKALKEGHYPRVIVRVAIASNGAAFLCLLWGAIAGEWTAWTSFAPAYMWASLGLAGLLAAAFIILGPVAHRKGKA